MTPDDQLNHLEELKQARLEGYLLGLKKAVELTRLIDIPAQDCDAITASITTEIERPTLPIEPPSRTVPPAVLKDTQYPA